MSDFCIVNGELYHYGVKGMKWGVHRERKQNIERSYRKKLDSIIKNKNADTADVKRFKYRNQSYGKRFAKTAASGVTQMLIGEMFSGNISRYGQMNKQQLRKELTKKALSLTATTAANVAIKDAMAKSASKRYTDDGKRVKGTKSHIVSKETIIEKSIGVAVRAAPLLAFAGITKLSTIAADRARNEANFKKWGANILPEKVDNVIWQSDDLMYSIIDNRNR